VAENEKVEGGLLRVEGKTGVAKNGVLTRVPAVAHWLDA
jgi:hypothetical protein